MQRTFWMMIASSLTPSIFIESATAQELPPDDARERPAGEAPVMSDAAPTRSLELAPLALLLPALRVTYEQQLGASGTTSFGVGGAIGTQVWATLLPPILSGDTLPLNVGAYGQLRKYFLGDFTGGVYASAELIASLTRQTGFYFDDRGALQFGKVNTTSLGGLLYLGAKNVRPSGLTLDVSLGFGPSYSPTIEALSFLISPRFDLGWSF